MRRLDRACQHVTDMWFPANPQLLKRIKRAISQGELTTGRAIYGEVRQDYSLYLRCLKELARLARTREGSQFSCTDPEALFTHSPPEDLTEVLTSLEDEISPHTFDKVTPLQALRLEDALVSASAVEAMCDPVGIDTDLGYSVALLRQLGQTLIAFNYADIYEKALAALKPGESLEVEIAKTLGFTPSLLAATLLQRWGLAPGLIDGVGTSRSDKLNAVGSTLAKLAEIGEALARANHPDLYPSAGRDWEFARKEIERRLGKRGISVIRRKIKENCREYIARVPTLFRGGIMLDPEARIAERWDEEHLRRNPFLAACSGDFKREMHRFYLKFDEGTEARDRLADLVNVLIPLSGYRAGVIYTIDPCTEMLIPQLKIGKVSLRAMGPVQYGTKDDVVARAFECEAALVSTVSTQDSGYLTSVAGVIGFSQRVGVLYLEIDHETFSIVDTDFVAHFKALSKALTDALQVG